VSSTGSADPRSILAFEGAFLRRLERLSVVSRRPLHGIAAGHRGSPRRGSSVEFADYRDYAPGDDFRRVDWKAYGRLDRLFIRLYSAEESSTLTLFLDRSASMRFGNPPKSLFAARLAAVLTYIAVHKYDMVSIAGWGERLDTLLPPRGGTAATHELWATITDLMSSPQGETDFAALQAFRHLRRGPGVAIVISDVLGDSDWRVGIKALSGAGQELTVIQVLAPEELDPRIRGDWKLQDSENANEVEITLSPRVLKRYHESLAAHIGNISAYCRQQGVHFVQLSSGASISDSVIPDLHSAGLLA
jgi:uncharacterized protein (DUF58 family)